MIRNKPSAQFKHALKYITAVSTREEMFATVCNLFEIGRKEGLTECYIDKKIHEYVFYEEIYEDINLLDLLIIITRQTTLPNYVAFVQLLYFEVLKKYLKCTEQERRQIHALFSGHCKSVEEFSEIIKLNIAKRAGFEKPDYLYLG